VTRGKRAPLQVYLSDGNAGHLTKELAKDADAKIETIGESRENVGIVRFSARKNSSLGTDYVLATVKNYGDLTRSFTMEFVVNGLTQKVIPKTLAAGVEESESFQTRLPEGGSLQLKLGFDVKSAETAPSSGATSGAEAVADGLELDNSAYAVAYPDRLRRVVLVTATPEEAAPFKIAFRAMREVVDESSRAVTLEDYEKLAPEERQADVTICHGVVPTVFPVRGNLILIHTPLPSFVPATLAGEEASPTILDWDREHVLNRYLNYREMRIPPAHIVKLNAGVKIVDGGEGALVAAFDLEDRRVLYVAFDMTSQLFPFRLAFPMLLRNTVAWFETEEDLLFEETYAPGSTISPLRRVSIDKALARFVKGGREESVEIPVDRGRFRYEDTETPGPIVFRLGEREFGTAVNLFDGSESMIGVDRNAPRNVLGGSRGFRFGSGEWWTYFALAGLALWALEWALYHRRVTE
jgi:hypothetical protein